MRFHVTIAATGLLLNSIVHAQTPSLAPTVNGKHQVIITTDKPPPRACWTRVKGKQTEFVLEKVTVQCLDATNLKHVNVVHLPDGGYQVDGTTVPVRLIIGPAGPMAPGAPVDQGPVVVVYESNGAKVVRAKEITPAKKVAPKEQAPKDPPPKDGAREQPATTLRIDAKTALSTFDDVPDAKCWKKSTEGAKDYELLNASDDCMTGLQLSVARKLEVNRIGEYWLDGQKIKPSWLLGKEGPLKLTGPFDTGPYLLAYGEKLVRATTITTRKQMHEACTWPETKDDLQIDLLRRGVDNAPDRNVVGTNQGLIVRVCHDSEQDITVQWGGTRGMTRSTLRKEEARGGTDQEDVKPVQISTLRFSPRQAGSADLKVFEGTDTTKTPLFSTELEVEPRYWGAVRFGLGTLSGGGPFDAWKSYDVVTFSGSRQQEVREIESNTSFELVSGFAPYLESFSGRCGGRSHTGGSCNIHVAPFIGFGVLGTTTDKGIQGLSSFHAGIDIEFASNFSIAVTYVHRRMRTLAGGYMVGSPVATGLDADDVTTDSWGSGLAIVLNASPSFLQFATGTPATSKGEAQ